MSSITTQACEDGRYEGCRKTIEIDLCEEAPAFVCIVCAKHYAAEDAPVTTTHSVPCPNELFTESCEHMNVDVEADNWLSYEEVVAAVQSGLIVAPECALCSPDIEQVAKGLVFDD